MWNLLQKHPNPELRWAWNATQLGVLLIPLIPLIGALLLVASAANSTYHQGGVMATRPLNRGFAWLALGMVLVSFLGEVPGEAFLGLAHFLPYFWLFAAQAELTGHPGQLRQLAQLIVLPVLLLVLIGWGELYLGWSRPLILGGLLPWPVNAFGTPPGRMASLFSYANNLALYLTVTFSLGLGLWCASWQRQPEREEREEGVTAWFESWSMRSQGLLWTLVLLTNAAGIILTQSRSAWGLMALSALAAAIYLGWNILVSAVMGFVGAILWAAFGPIGRVSLRQIIPAFFWARLTDQNFPDRPLPTLRKTQWQFTLDLIHQRPLQGWGLRNFSALYEAQTQVWMGHPHNLFLMLGAEIGLPLTLMLIGLIGWIFAQTTHYFVCNKKYKYKTFAHCIFGAFLLALINITLFHGFDILFFDFRINAMAWIIVSQILGEFYLSSVGNLSLRRSGSPDSN